MGLGSSGITEEEFNAALKRMGIEPFSSVITRPECLIHERAIRFKKDKYVFKSAIPLDALEEINELHGIDGMPETRRCVLEGLCEEIRFLLLHAGEIEEFVDLFGWDDLEEFATKFPIVEKWLADPNRRQKHKGINRPAKP